MIVDSSLVANERVEPRGNDKAVQFLGRDRVPLLFVWTATAAYACLASYFALRRHDAFRSRFDLANFDQGLWLFAQGDEPFITQHGRHLLGDHFDPGLTLLLPVYVVGAGPQALLVLQSLAIAAVAPLLFALARTRGAQPWVASLPALLWLASPLTLGQNMDDFHHIPLAAPAIVASIVALERQRLVLFVALGLLACSLKEDIPLLYAMVGLVVLLEGRRRLGIGIVTGALAVFAFAVVVWIPHFSNSLDWFAKRFAGPRGDSVTDVGVWAVRHPIALVQHVATFQDAGIAMTLIVTTGGLCLLGGRWMILALPFFAHNLLSALPEQHQLWLHYQFPVMLALAIAGAVGVSKLRNVRSGRVRRLMTVWVGVAFLLFPLGVAFAAGESRWTAEDRRELGGPDARREALSLVPDDASVAANVFLTPHLSQRHEIYTLPLPFIFVDYGGDLTPEDFERRARGVEYVVVDRANPPRELPNLASVLPPLLERRGFRLKLHRGSILVYAHESVDR